MARLNPFEALGDFVRQVRRVASWLPVLWRDRDYDYSYAVYLLMFKMLRVAKHIAEHDVHMGAQRCARDIRIVVEHFKRVQRPDLYPMGWTKERSLRQARQQDALEAWHWDRAWELIRRKGKCWWD